MNVRTKMLGVALAATVAVGVITAASASASKPAHHFRAGHGKGSITGFPNSDQHGRPERLHDRHELHAREQHRQHVPAGLLVDGVDAFAIGGPFVGGPHFASDYTALPIGHKMLMIAWFNQTGVRWSTDIFVMNFKTGIVSDIAPPNAQPVSLGTVKIVKYGPHRIP